MEEQQCSVVQQMLQAAQHTQESCAEVKGVQGGSDFKPRPRFNPTEDVNALEKAITGKEVDTGSIIDILTKRTNEQRQEIKAAYLKKTGKTLEEALKKSLSAKLASVILDMLKTPEELDASKIKAATKGLGTDEDTLIEIFVTRPNQQIRKIKEVYKAAYKTDLEKDITDDTSGDFRTALLVLSKGVRSEDCFVNEDLADKDAKALFEAGENKKKADASKFIEVLTERSFPHLHQVFKNYAKYSKHDLNTALDLQLKGDIENCLVAIVKVAVGRPAYFAEKLSNALKSWKTQDEIVNRIIVSRHEIDFKAIKTQFKKITGKSLRAAIMEKSSGDYETVLAALCGYDDE
ncbi:annexin A1-like isoform X2 [Bufo gargarizans]|uniref:annexin A1-like isoform X2 n=1 Tax=Bufo gargarizans TaxID=30331 RepID=UPI001CF52C44|nr:annexin A1-like isoform X2 [Bufo gargarizans]